MGIGAAIGDFAGGFAQGLEQGSQARARLAQAQAAEEAAARAKKDYANKEAAGKAYGQFYEGKLVDADGFNINQHVAETVAAQRDAANPPAPKSALQRLGGAAKSLIGVVDRDNVRNTGAATGVGAPAGLGLSTAPYMVGVGPEAGGTARPAASVSTGQLADIGAPKQRAQRPMTKEEAAWARMQIATNFGQDADREAAFKDYHKASVDSAVSKFLGGTTDEQSKIATQHAGVPVEIKAVPMKDGDPEQLYSLTVNGKHQGNMNTASLGQFVRGEIEDDPALSQAAITDSITRMTGFQNLALDRQAKKAQIAASGAQTAASTQATGFAAEEHPYKVRGLQAAETAAQRDTADTTLLADPKQWAYDPQAAIAAARRQGEKEENRNNPAYWTTRKVTNADGSISEEKIPRMQADIEKVAHLMATNPYKDVIRLMNEPGGGKVWVVFDMQGNRKAADPFYGNAVDKAKEVYAGKAPQASTGGRNQPKAAPKAAPKKPDTFASRAASDRAARDRQHQEDLAFLAARAKLPKGSGSSGIGSIREAAARSRVENYNKAHPQPAAAKK